MKDLYQSVTDRIVAALEGGVMPWLRPWKDATEAFPVNAASRRPYQGLNVLVLTLEALERGYSRNAWLTFRQAAELGAHVRAGEKGSTVFFARLHTPDEREGKQTLRPRSFPILRAFYVFNTAQIDGLPEHLAGPAPAPAWEPLEEAEALLADSQARIAHGGDRAFYRPEADSIQLPERRLFPEPGAYYATALHELLHWAGHRSRLNRDLKGRFGSAAYAAEELVAEIGAAFVCAQIGIEGQLQHAEYIGSWLEVLRQDKRAIFTAASKAQQGADFVLGLRRQGVVEVELEGELA